MSGGEGESLFFIRKLGLGLVIAGRQISSIELGSGEGDL